jgi:hypothetical protein
MASTVTAATVDRPASTSAAKPARAAGETSPTSVATGMTLRQSGDRTAERENRSRKQRWQSGFPEYSE